MSAFVFFIYQPDSLPTLEAAQKCPTMGRLYTTMLLARNTMHMTRMTCILHNCAVISITLCTDIRVRILRITGLIFCTSGERCKLHEGTDCPSQHQLQGTHCAHSQPQLSSPGDCAPLLTSCSLRINMDNLDIGFVRPLWSDCSLQDISCAARWPQEGFASVVSRSERSCCLLRSRPARPHCCSDDRMSRTLERSSAKGKGAG